MVVLAYIYKPRVLPLEGYATADRVTGGIHSGWTFLTIAMEQQVKSAAEKTVSVGHCVCLHSRLSTQLRLLICFGMSGDRRGSGPTGEMHSKIPPTPRSRNFHKKNQYLVRISLRMCDFDFELAQRPSKRRGLWDLAQQMRSIGDGPLVNSNADRERHAYHGDKTRDGLDFLRLACNGLIYCLYRGIRG